MTIRSFPFLVLIALVSTPSQVTAQKCVILVRHADRDADVPDGITPQGRARADALALALKHSGLTLVVRSDTQRTKDTAAPIVAMNVAEKIVTADMNHVKNVHDTIKAAGDKAVVLYVGHSNTIGPLLRMLGHQEEVTLGAAEYGTMFILVPRQPAPAVIKLHYGARDE